MLILHRAERSGTLADALGQVLSTPLADPFTREIVSVPAKGVERWLNQRLSTVLGTSTGDGIAANIDFPTPTRLVDTAISAASGLEADDDPWSPGRVLWATLAVIDDSLSEPWCAVLARHLGYDSSTGSTEGYRAGRRWATAAHVTDLLRGYAAARPQMLIDWSAGAYTDGVGESLPSDLLWQAELWQRLRTRIGSPSPAERLGEACDALRRQPDLVDFPERLSLFGPTRLSADQLQVVSALATGRDVHLWIPHPSPAMWTSLATKPTHLRRSADNTALDVPHPLLSSLARDVRELQVRLGSLDVEDVHHEAVDAPATLLGRIQDDIRLDRTPTTSATLDGTVQVHACHGAPRQVEVLRECLLHLFTEDPTLEPRDVLVLCPDVETYAPLVRATFGQGLLGHPGHRLRVRLADRGLRQTNPLLASVATFLELAEGRVTASQVLDLATSAPVRTMFRFTDDDLERLREWTHASGARWGIGSRQREAYGLGDFPQNTFNTAVDRILLGVAADETDNSWLDLALPLDDVDGNDIDLAGRFAEMVDRLAVVLRDLQGPQTVSDWIRVLRRSLDLLTDVRVADQWQVAGAHRELADATEHGATTELRLADVRAMLASRLAGRPTRANFRTGELTVCTMVPMRSVPHRVVVLLGLDDDVFPRTSNTDGDDVLARNPLVGERDLRSEDRQLLLDAVMSASDRLLLFYTGADPVSGVSKPPAIPLSELLDVVTLTAGADPVQRHPLQPFDPRNFDAVTPFSFDTGALAGARASRRPSEPIPPFLPSPLPEMPTGDVNLSDLVAFVQNPTQAFLRQRLRFRVPEVDDDIADALDVELAPLSRWNIGDRMLSAVLGGTELSEFAAAEWRRGTLPPFKQGARQLNFIESGVMALAAASRSVHVGAPTSVDVAVDLGDGRRITGTIPGIHGYVVARTRYSTLGPKHRLEAWVHLLALSAYAPDGIWEAVTTGKGKRSIPISRSTMSAPAHAVDILRQLVDLRDRGMAAPLPMATDSTAVYAERRARGVNADAALTAASETFSDKFGDNTDRSIVYVYGKSPTLASLGDGPPEGDEASWSDDPTRFGALAFRLWRPLLDRETQGQP
ncbi:exodeoxyribonuclease V subunit gamma [Rhodococcoides trifolii]|nr:exodeoxyribonuclease V subunit gamma [Rhodococcus trifolii]